MGTLVGILIVFAILAAIYMSARSKSKALRTAPQGSTRMETSKASQVGGVVRRYAACGWTVEGQSSAKSLGSQARVTITFRKA